MRNAVTVRKLKYDGSIKREYEGDLVDANESWLVVYHIPGRHSHLVYGEPSDFGVAQSLQFMNLDLPLVATVTFDELGRVPHHYVDAALPTTIAGRTISWIDLDLDIDSPIEGRASIWDIEELEQRRREMRYPDEVVDAAWRGIRIGSELLANGRFPFDGSASTLLGRILASEGPL